MYTITEKLELRFRPDDPYCKPTSGERSPCTGLLLKVKIVKKRKKSGNQTVDIVPQVLGKVTSWFQFKSKLSAFLYNTHEETLQFSNKPFSPFYDEIGAYILYYMMNFNTCWNVFIFLVNLK